MPRIDKRKYWRNEIEPRLETLSIFQHFQSFSEYDSYYHELHSSLIETLYFCHNRSKLILEYLPEYTLHDSDHLFRVLEICGEILSDNGLEKLSIVDTYSLIISIFLHDIGLAPTRKELDAWRYQIGRQHAPKTDDIESISNFIRTFPKRLDLLNEYYKSDDRVNATRIENEFLTKYLRETHGRRAQRIIEKEFKDSFIYRDTNLTPHISMICHSHTIDALQLKELDDIVHCGGGVTFSPQYCAVLLRLSDLTDFDAKRAPNSLFDALSVEDSISIREWMKHRSVSAWTLRTDMFALHADCDHPIIQDGIYEYCDILDAELLKCKSITAAIDSSILRDNNPYTALELPSNINRDYIRPKRDVRGLPIYTFSKTRFTLDQDKVVDLLMGTSLYGNPAVALRELLQNSIDACMVREAFEKSWGNEYRPRIDIALLETSGRQFIVVEDNGIGMDENIVQNYYSKVGACFYSSPEFYNLLSTNGITFVPISRFGIGVLSYFLVSNRVQIETRRISGNNMIEPALEVKVDGVNGLFWFSESAKTSIGTVTRIELIEEHPWRRFTDKEMIDEIQRIMPEPPFEIALKVGEQISHFGGRVIESADVTSEYRLEYPEIRARVRVEEVSFSSEDRGYEFMGTIRWLEKSGRPVKKFTTVSKKVNIEGMSAQHSLDNSIELRTNRMTHWSSSFDIRDDDVYRKNSYRDFMRSSVALSLHGFHVPFSPFKGAADDWDEDELKPKCELLLPFVIKGAMNIRSPRDLSLNAARDNVLPDEKWFRLRGWFVREILEYINASMDLNNKRILLKMMTETDSDRWMEEITESFY